MPNEVQRYVLLTGSDLGDRTTILNQASLLIEYRIGPVIQKSMILESEPWGFQSETRFLNQALMVETTLDPEQLLSKILEIETLLGRVRHSAEWTSRIIDIDILCGEFLIHHSSSLVIPHKLLADRLFALNPLCQIVPDWIHPLLNRSYLSLAEDLRQQTLVNRS
jgi:2-amino-4-hydroxy-6-hydroxymethyldihydropteridine diphosphokinase